LFADKREVELVWNGKTRDVCTAVLPFQTLEHIDEPRKEKSAAEELDLDSGGRPLKGWTNKLIWGANKPILSSLKAGALRRRERRVRPLVRALARRRRSSLHPARRGGGMTTTRPSPIGQPVA